MPIQITVPELGESVTEATVGQWFKKPGDTVNADEPLVELETEKVTVEVPSPVAGVLTDIKVAPGTTVKVGSVLGSISGEASAPRKAPPRVVAQPRSDMAPTRLISPHPAPAAKPAPERAPAPAPAPAVVRLAPAAK